MKIEVKPNFLIPGAGRSGTTSLVYYLDEHPDIYFPRVREINFFTRYYDKGEQWYLNRFKEWDLGHLKAWSGEPLVGDATTRYMYTPQATERMYQFNKDFKLIFSLRNPVERAYSNYRVEVQVRGRTRSFEEILEQSDGSHYIEAGKYYTHIKRFLNYFPEDQMLFVLFEDFVSETASELKRICQFLGADSNFKFTRINKKKNIAKIPISFTLQRWISKYFISRDVDAPIVLRCLKRAIRSVVNPLNHLNRKEFPPMADSTRKHLTHLFEEEVSSLENLIGRDLSHWK